MVEAMDMVKAAVGTKVTVMMIFTTVTTMTTIWALAATIMAIMGITVTATKDMVLMEVVVASVVIDMVAVVDVLTAGTEVAVEEITNDDMIMMMAGLEYLVEETTGHTESYSAYDNL